MSRFLSLIRLSFCRPIIPFYCLEALLYLIFFRVLIVFLPFRFWGHRFGIAYAETLKTDYRRHYPKMNLIVKSVNWVSSIVPWKSLCLDRALAGARILKSRGLSSTIYIGLAKQTDSHWNAHAWLRCGDRFIMGYSEDQPFKLVKTIACLA